jgi:protein O-GlcNAc transferase
VGDGAMNDFQAETRSAGDNGPGGDRLFEQALERHNAGRFEEAAELCRRVLHAEPRNADAAFLLGVTAYQTGDYASAVELMQQATAVAPREGRFHSGLGVAQMRLGRTDEAEESLRRAVGLDDDAESRNNLGNFFKDQNRLDEAIGEYTRALADNPQYASARYNLGDALWLKGELNRAAECFERAAEDVSLRAMALPSLGRALLALGRGKEAEDVLQRALALSPQDAALHRDLGDALQAQRRGDDAAAAYRNALRLDPKSARSWYSAGCLEIAREQYAAAALCFREALQIEPDWPEAQHNLGQALFNLGQADEAVELFRKAAQRTDFELPWMSLATTIPISPRADNQTVLETRRAWAQRFLPRPRSAERFSDRRGPSDRPLRVGYVSSFFHRDNWMKPVWGLINQHDRRQFEVHLFGDMPASAVRHGYRPNDRDQFHDLTGMTPQAAADRVEQAAIDILVDLNSYSAPRWLPLLALRPAPLIVGWFNVFATTGMACYDYLIGDGEAVPPEEEQFLCEKIVRVPGSYLTFAVEYPVPDVVAPPCERSRAITFGCLAPQYKIDGAVMSAWADILRQAPQASLILKNAFLGSRANRDFVEEALQRHGVPVERVRLEGPADHYEFLKTYSQIDVALDTFPYNGGTTTTEAIWQGVPVVTFRGDRWASRTSVSILRAAGLGEFIAADVDAYVSLAVRWANSVDGPDDLGKLRREMRSRLRGAPVCDVESFARNMERLYTQMWEQWLR